WLELKASGAGTLSEGRDAAGVSEAVAVEDHGFDAGLLAGFGDLLADREREGHLGLALVTALADFGDLLGFESQVAGSGQGLAGGVVDQLGVDVRGAAEDRQARALGSTAD